MSHRPRRQAARLLALALSATFAATALSAPPTQAADNGYTYAGEFAAFSGTQNASLMAVAPNGQIYVVGVNPGSTPGAKVGIFTPAGVQIGGWDLDFENLGGISIDSAGTVYIGDSFGSVVDNIPSAVHVFSPTGVAQREFTRDDADLAPIGDVAVDAAGVAYTVDPLNNLVSKFAPTGAYLGSFGTFGSGPSQFDQPSSIAVSPTGTLYVADLDNNRVQIFVAATGQLIGQFGQAGAGNGQFSLPREVAVAPNGHVFVIDNSTRVQEFTADGQFVRVAASTQLNDNFDIAFGSGDTLYVAGYLRSLQRGVAIFTAAPPPVGGGAVIVAKKLKTKKGKATVAITCAANTVCSGKITLKQKKTTLGKKKYAVAAGATTKVKIRLTGKAKALLRRNKQIKATVTLKPAIGAKTVTKVKLRR